MINDKKILAVITARAGSKGIKNKNFREILGKPLFIWSVLAAMGSKYVDYIVVSSNCDQVYNILNDFVKRELELCRCNRTSPHPNLPFYVKRPEEISGDKSKNEEALIHVLEQSIFNFDITINLQPTSPCRTGKLLDKTIEEYCTGDYDSLLTVSKYTPFFWQKINNKWVYNIDKNDCCNRKMRQEFEECEFLFHDTGNIYISDTKMLLETKCRIGDNPCIFETKGLNSLQIDEEFDFELIENMAKAYNLKSLV